MVKKGFLVILIFIFVLAHFSELQVLAHNMDKGFLELTYPDKSTFLATQKTLRFELYASWQSVSYIVNVYGSNIVPKPVSDPNSNAFDNHLAYLMSNHVSYEKYFQEHLLITSGGKDCLLKFDAPIQPEKTDVLVGKGIKISGRIQCPTKITKIVLVDNVLFDDIPLQTNMLAVRYENQAPFFEKTLGKDDRQAVITFDIVPALNKSDLGRTNITKLPFILTIVSLLSLTIGLLKAYKYIKQI